MSVIPHGTLDPLSDFLPDALTVNALCTLTHSKREVASVKSTPYHETLQVKHERANGLHTRVLTGDTANHRAA